jgi:hypothetical protein
MNTPLPTHAGQTAAGSLSRMNAATSSGGRITGPAFFNASHVARCVARHGVRSQADPVALVGESIAVVALAVKERPD